jgi:hypothetical protein
VKLSLQEHIKRSREAVAANKAKGNKHAELFATMYTQPSRFIEEILQNTEDACARKNSNGINFTIRFKLFPDKIEIHHHGKDFDEEDLMSITTFANTTKKNNSEVNLIGKFGIGFKSVFSITEFPEIHCNSYHYKIEDYEILTACKPLTPDEGFNTLIVLPFKRKSKNECFTSVKHGLHELNDNHLLFLKKLNRVEVFDQNRLFISIERESIRLKKNLEKRMVLKKTYFPLVTEDHKTFLVYYSEGRNQHKLPELAFMVSEINQSYTFLPVTDALLFVYFPLKMNSGITFLIHAPFTTNPLRDFAWFDNENCPENTQMLNDAVHSFVSALSAFKKIGFYSVDLLSKLFVKQPEKESSDRQKSIIQEKFFTAYRDFLSSNDNIPLGDNRFSKIENVLIPEDEAIYRLLHESDLRKLFQKDNFIDPVICSETMSSFRYFLTNDLHIKTVDAESFGFRIRVTSGFLEDKSIKWLKEFYNYLHSQQKLWDSQHTDLYYSIRTAPVIFTERNTFEAAFDMNHNPKVFLSGRKKEMFAVVHHKLLEDEYCFAFFNELEIKKVDAYDDVIQQIIPHLGQMSNIKINDYVKKLEKVLLVYGEVSYNQKKILLDLLGKTAWVYSEDFTGNKSFTLPNEVYFKNELLLQYFTSCPSIRFFPATCFTKLVRKYPVLAQSFFSETGIAFYPKIHYKEDKKSVIDGFDDFILNIDFNRSKAFAKILITATENYFPEDVLQFLRKQKWIYTKKGSFEAPETINISDLSGKYRFNEAEKIRFQILMGLGSHQKVNENTEFTWQPKVKPEEIDLNILFDPNINQTKVEANLNLLSAVQTCLNFFEPKDIELKEYSSAELENINKWSFEFLFRFLQLEFQESRYKVETSPTADFIVYENGNVFRYVFASGKTDLMNHFPFSMGKFVNICKLLNSKEITFLYCINSAGTSGVSVRQIRNPFEMILNEKILCNGRIFLNPEQYFDH